MCIYKKNIEKEGDVGMEEGDGGQILLCKDYDNYHHNP